MSSIKKTDKALHDENERLKTIIIKARKTILDYGGYDGSHHKQWALDQALRILSGDDYKTIIKEYENGEEGPNTYEWGTGR